MTTSNSLYHIDTSSQLYGYENMFNNLVRLYDNGNLPKISLISGDKGIGKFTLIFHFVAYIFSKNNKNSYDIEKNLIYDDNLITNKIKSKTFQNFIYFPNEDRNKLSIEQIRSIKKNLSSSTLDNNPRFIVFDDVEFLNNNVVNSLLKMIEEPNHKNYFILINNKKNKLIETLRSRSIETKIFLNHEQKKNILNKLLISKKINNHFCFEHLDLTTPGMIIKFQRILSDINAVPESSFYELTSQLLDKYKKDKEDIYIECIKFLLEIKCVKNNFSSKKNIFSSLSLKNNILKVLYNYKKFSLTNNSVLKQVKNFIN